MKINKINIGNILCAIMAVVGFMQIRAEVPEFDEYNAQGDYRVLVEGGKYGLYDVINAKVKESKASLKFYNTRLGSSRLNYTFKCNGNYKCDGNKITIVEDGNTLSISSPDGRDFTGTYQTADGTQRNCVVYTDGDGVGYKYYNVKIDEFADLAAKGDFRKAYIYINNDNVALAMPVTVKFTPLPDLAIQKYKPGIISITSDNPFLSSLGDLTCAYYFTKQDLKVVTHDGELTSKFFPSELNFRIGKRIIKDLGEVNVDLELFFMK